MLKFNIYATKEKKMIYNLNTSHVKVQRLAIFGILLLVYYLNTSHVKVQLDKCEDMGVIKRFKYISC